MGKKKKDAAPTTASSSQTFRWYQGLESRDRIAGLFAALDSPTMAANLLIALGPDDVDADISIETATGPPDTKSIVALDCEMVGVMVPSKSENKDDQEEPKSGAAAGLPKTPAPPSLQPALARVSIVDYHGNILLDTFAKPAEFIYDYKTRYSGVTEKHLENAPSVESVQKRTQEILKGKYIVGQSLSNDLGVLDITDTSPQRLLDTATYYRRFHPRGMATGLKHLARMCLNLEIQQGEHDSVIDARVSMLLYRQLRKIWNTTYDPVFEPKADGEYVAPPLPKCFPAPLRSHFDVVRSVPIGERFPAPPGPPIPQHSLSLIPFLNAQMMMQSPQIHRFQLPTMPALPLTPTPASPSMMAVLPGIASPIATTLHPLVRNHPKPSHKIVKATFYPWMNSKQIRFDGWPAWELAESVEVSDEWFVTLKKVDTSLPGKRKRTSNSEALESVGEEPDEADKDGDEEDGEDDEDDANEEGKGEVKASGTSKGTSKNGEKANGIDHATKGANKKRRRADISNDDSAVFTSTDKNTPEDAEAEPKRKRAKQGAADDDEVQVSPKKRKRRKGKRASQGADTETAVPEAVSGDLAVVEGELTDAQGDTAEPTTTKAKKSKKGKADGEKGTSAPDLETPDHVSKKKRVDSVTAASDVEDADVDSARPRKKSKKGKGSEDPTPPATSEGAPATKGKKKRNANVELAEVEPVARVKRAKKGKVEDDAETVEPPVKRKKRTVAEEAVAEDDAEIAPKKQKKRKDTAGEERAPADEDNTATKERVADHPDGLPAKRSRKAAAKVDVEDDMDVDAQVKRVAESEGVNDDDVAAERKKKKKKKTKDN